VTRNWHNIHDMTWIQTSDQASQDHTRSTQLYHRQH